MKSNKKFTISVLMIVILIIGIFWYFSFKQKIKKENNIEIDKNLYDKEIKIGDENIKVIFKKNNNESIRYQFYSVNSTLLKEVESFITIENADEIFNRNFFTKDITGDQIPEIFIMVEQSQSGGNFYEILHFDNGVINNIKLKNQNDNKWVSFDEIEYQNGYIMATWHAVDVIGKTKYKLENNVLIPVKNIGYFWSQYIEDSCEVRENKFFDDYVVIAKGKCSVLGNNFDQYFK